MPCLYSHTQIGYKELIQNQAVIQRGGDPWRWSRETLRTRGLEGLISLRWHSRILEGSRPIKRNRFEIESLRRSRLRGVQSTDTSTQDKKSKSPIASASQRIRLSGADIPSFQTSQAPASRYVLYLHLGRTAPIPRVITSRLHRSSHFPHRLEITLSWPAMQQACWAINPLRKANFGLHIHIALRMANVVPGLGQGTQPSDWSINEVPRVDGWRSFQWVVLGSPGLRSGPPVIPFHVWPSEFTESSWDFSLRPESLPIATGYLSSDSYHCITDPIC